MSRATIVGNGQWCFPSTALGVGSELLLTHVAITHLVYACGCVRGGGSERQEWKIADEEPLIDCAWRAGRAHTTRPAHLARSPPHVAPSARLSSVKAWDWTLAASGRL